MSDWVAVCEWADLPPGSRRLLSTAEHRIAVFRVGEQLLAVDNHCPHRGGPIAAGQWTAGCLTCPWHGLQFDLLTGRSLPAGDHTLTHLPVKVESEKVLVDIGPLERSASADESSGDGIQRYLVRYGRLGHVGCFGSLRGAEQVERGQRVVVQTARGREAGVVLQRAAASDLLQSRQPAGELLGPMDEELEALALSIDAAHLPLLELAQQSVQAKKLPLVLVDGELLLDGESVVLYYLGQETEALGPLAVDLARRDPPRHVQFEKADLDDAPATRFPLTYQPPPGVASDQESAVKGPYERQKYDLRRVWECPVCQHRERSSGSVTTMVCACQSEQPFTEKRHMRLVEDGPRKI